MGKVLSIGSLATSLVVGLVALWTLEALQLKYALAFTLTLFVLVLMNLYTHHDRSFSLHLTRDNFGLKILFLGWVSAILFVISINSLETSSQFLVWHEIPVLLWLRLIASFSLTTIYPGYAITTLVRRGRNLQLLEKIVFSMLSSIFISAIIAFVGILVNRSIGSLSFFILIAVNIFLLILASYLARHKLLSMTRPHHVIRIQITDITRPSLLLLLLTFILLAGCSVNFDKFVPTIDQWLHYGNILRALNGTLFSFVPLFYWLYMYAGLFIYGAGLPPINAFMILLVLCILPILSFYLMCSGFWDKRKALVATTVYTLFSGFGGIYANYLRLTSGNDLTWIMSYAANKTYDISAGAVSFSFFFFPKLIGLSTLFTLIYLIYDKKLPRLGRIILTSIIFALGYLTHVAETYVFLLVATFLLLFSRKDASNLKDLPHGLILGLITIAMIDFVAPQKKYGLHSLLKGHLDLVSLGLVGMVVLSYILSRLRLNVSSFGRIMTKAAEKLSLPIIIAFIYILSVSIIVWAFLLPTFSIGYTGGTFVWYLYPVRLGIALFMAVFGAHQLFRIKEFRILKFSIIIILIAVSLERALSYLIAENMMQFAFFSPIRMVEFAWIGVAMLAAPVLIRILNSATGSYNAKREIGGIPRRFASTVLLAMIVGAGASSTLYNVQIRSTPSMVLTGGELEALDFLRNETPSTVTVLALGDSVNKINDFGGRFPLLYYDQALFRATNFEAFVDIIKHNPRELYGHFPVKYFWLSNSDISELTKYEKGYFVDQLLNYLPIVYENNEVTIFEIPPFSPMSPESDLAVLVSTSNISKQSIFMSTIALAGLDYTIRYDFDLDLPASTLFLTNDPNHDLNYLVATKVKKLVVFNTDAFAGHFAKILQIRTNTNRKQIINGISGSSINLSLPSMEIPTFYSLDDDVEPLVYYTKDEQLLSPYAFRKLVGNQEIIYVEIYPYFETLQRNAGTDVSSEMFMKLDALIEVLDLQLPKYKPSLNTMARAILFGQATFGDDLSFDTTSFYIPALDAKSTQAIGWKEDTFHTGWSTSTNKPESSSVYISTYGDILSVTFNASDKNVWQYLFLSLPKVNASQYRFLFLREKIEASSYNIGHLRIVAGGYTYTIRGWISETKPPGHPWVSYIFDLNEGIPEKQEAPMPPRGSIESIYWTGFSTADSGGIGKLYVDYVMLANWPFAPTNYGDIVASLDLSEADLVLVNATRTAEKVFANTTLLGFQIEGQSESTFRSNEAQLIPPSLGYYSRIIFNTGAEMTLRLTDDAQGSFILLTDGTATNVTVIGGTVDMSLKPLKGEIVVYMSSPRVSAKSSTTFEKAFISRPYGIYNPGLPMEVDDATTFRVNVMDQDFSLISELEGASKYKVLTQQQVKWNEWDIPWVDIITEPYHLVLVIGIVTGLVVHILQKNRKRVRLRFRQPHQSW